MSKTITLTTVAVDATSGPFPPSYPAGAKGYIGVQSNPSGSFAGVISSAAYYSSTIVAIANDAAVPTQFMVSLLGSWDKAFLGNVTTPDGKVYVSANATYAQNLVGVNTITSWIWPLAVGGVVLATGQTVTIADTGDTLVSIAGSAHSSTQLDLTWVNSGPTPPVEYDLYRLVGLTGSPTLYQTLAGTVLAYSDTGLTANQAYSYYVVAVYADGTHAPSVQIQLFTPASGMSQQFNCDCQVATPDGWTTDTLLNLRKRIMIRGGYASQVNNPPPGMKDLINDFLQDAQMQLYRQHKEFKQIRFYAWQMQPGVRYYGLTADESGCQKLDPLSVEWVGFEDLNQAWYKLEAGIDPVMYTRAQISTGWPTNYEIRQCIEIFPAPKSQYTLWIKGRFGLLPFAADADLTTIDAEAIFLYALGNFKSHYGQVDAQTVLAQALAYTKYLVAGQHLTARYVPRTRVEAPWTPPKFLPLGSSQ